MTFSQFLSILKARWLSAMLVLVLTVGTTVGVSLVLPKNYTASAAVVLDVRSPDPIAGMVLGAMAMPAYMATQVDIIQSDRVAQRVVQGLRLTENAQTRAEWLEATEGQGNFEAWVAELLKKKLDVKPSRESNVVNVSYTSPDPRFAAALANAFVKAYMDVSIGLRVSPAKQYNEFFDARAKELRETLEQAQAKLTAYQKTSGILATDERFDIETQRLNELSSQLVALQALSAESGSRNAQARGSQSDQLQDVLSNPVVAGLRADLSRQEARLQELNARLGDAHPQVVELRANIAELSAKLQTESNRVSGSVGVTNTINKAREGEIRAALEAQRGKVLALKQQRDEASVLMKEVETAQRAYDQVVARASQTSLESQNTQTNISVLTPATEPATHSSPKLLLNTLLSIFLGTLLAVGYALVRELLDRRVRGPQDLVESLGLPVLGSLPRPMRGAPAGKAGNTLMLPTGVMARLPRPGR
ncbi:chain length determinant protein EpsF [Leptothrix discophora]|uniref:Chain length determinant protein EpsF n=1 Tax=Leptothrix discophora TaxID=89 RepID=A0ABT9G2F5_LEPDI|nr:chain length determinant protein EpsF [Leptothrix discophora]MDP4300665.1 chain length determinant protein EpsF [Leptothrix discophora]